MSATGYLDVSLPQIPRLLSLLDRDSYSDSFGSFHRSYWLHRVCDFSSNIQQIGFHSLALLWKHPFPNNPYYQNPQVLHWCKGGIRFCLSLQKTDGSFDEWYPNERGWAGPTGYILHALCDSYHLLKEEISPSLDREYQQAISKSAHFLLNGWEPDVLANHVAMALLPIYEAFEITEEPHLLEGYKVLFQKFLKYWDTTEGWGLEYDGPDIGYQSASLSFLGRLHRKNNCLEIKELAKKAVDFLSYFYFPHGGFSNKFGSRQTSICFVYGAEYWSHFFPMAQRMAQENRRMIKAQNMILPENHEDHYLIYRIPEFLESYLIAQDFSKESCLLPWEQDSFRKHFLNGKILIDNSQNFYKIINLGKGGVFHSYAKSKDKHTRINSGWIGKTKDGKTITSSSNHPDLSISIDRDRITIKGPITAVKNRQFTPRKMILFRVFVLLLGNSEKVSRKIKSGIRKILMFGNLNQKIGFERTILLNKDFHIEDRIFAKPNSILKLQWGGNFETRFVPQSRYFQKEELMPSQQNYDSKSLKSLHQGEFYHIPQEK